MARFAIRDGRAAWLGLLSEPAIFARAVQTGISEEDAVDIAELLNQRYRKEGRSGSY
jgi:hypothetical protein